MKDLTLVVLQDLLERELVSLVTASQRAALVIQESDLVREGSSMTPTRVETWGQTHQITEAKTSKPWGTS